MLRAIVLFGIAVSVACKDPTLPDRTFANSFADTIIVGTDTTIDLFRWPAHRLPVRFWADPRSNMAALVSRAVGIWEAQFLYGEFRGELVGDSARADVIVAWTDSVPPDVPPDTTPPNSCSGNTLFDFDSTGTALSGPIHVSLKVLATSATDERVQGCMRRIAIHEIGHSLGLLRHSAVPEDIMSGSPQNNLPSRFDRRTVELLYHSVPTIGPPPP
jgi:predicted Zn-dependent protease